MGSFENPIFRGGGGGGVLQKDNIQGGELPKKEFGKLSDLRGEVLAKKRRWCF